MPLWGNKNSANTNLVKNTPVSFGNATNAYANESIYNANVSVTEAHTPGTHAGWTSYRPGTGGVVSVSVTTAGTGYSNGDFVTYSGTQFNPANGSFYSATYVTPDFVTTNGSGGIVSVTTGLSAALWSNTGVTANVTTSKIASVTVDTIGASALSAGTYYLKTTAGTGVGANVSVTVVANGSVTIGSASVISGGHGYDAGTTLTLTGSTATFTQTYASVGTGTALAPVVGGKIGRKFYETLVALSTVVEDGVGGSGKTLP